MVFRNRKNMVPRQEHGFSIAVILRCFIKNTPERLQQEQATKDAKRKLSTDYQNNVQVPYVKVHKYYH